MKVYLNSQYIKKNNYVGIFFQPQAQHTEDLHRHEFIEFVYILSGNATQYIDNREYHAVRGDLLFIDYGSIHSFAPKDAFGFYNICFSLKDLTGSSLQPVNAIALCVLTAYEKMRERKDCACISFSGQDRMEVENILCAMLREYERNLPAGDIVLESYMNVLITKMFRRALLGSTDSASKDFWESLPEYIDRNLSEELTLSSLANKNFYNPSYFCRMFKQKFHMPLTEYVTRRRIDYVIQLLQVSDLSVDEIGFQAGFSDRSTFYSAFSKITGDSPAHYRSRLSR